MKSESAVFHALCALGRAVMEESLTDDKMVIYVQIPNGPFYKLDYALKLGRTNTTDPGYLPPCEIELKDVSGLRFIVSTDPIKVFP